MNSSSRKHIGVLGANGRMGQIICHLLAQSKQAELVAAADRKAGSLRAEIAIGTQAEAVFEVADAVIDFTNPHTVENHALLAAGYKKALIVGTTGLSPAHFVALQQAALKTQIFWAANMSLGVNLLRRLTQQVATILGPEFDIEILEMHHRHKIDAPSGTALSLGAAAAAGRGIDLADQAVRVRDGQTGPRCEGSIGFATLRGGDVIGDHTVLFAGTGERLELRHQASDRAIFAQGAIRAACWVLEQNPGYYGMDDLLTL